VTCLPYKEEGAAPFKAISRQVLFSEATLGCELRYFEMAAVPGRRRGARSKAVRPCHHPILPWHQFRATEGEPLGFLCMVNALRDRPQLPNEQEVAALKANPTITAFLARRAHPRLLPGPGIEVHRQWRSSRLLLSGSPSGSPAPWSGTRTLT
jgi:hypothetical protein